MKQKEEIRKLLQELRRDREQKRTLPHQKNPNPTQPTNNYLDNNAPPLSNTPNTPNQYNPNLPNQEEQPEVSEVQEILEIINTAKNLVKENQFNPEILSKLLTERDNNTFAYQIISQEGKGEELINQLEGIRSSQSQNNNNSSSKNPNPDKDKNSLTRIILFGSLFLAIIAVVGTIIMISKIKSRKSK
jgi:hypothetical protein